MGVRKLCLRSDVAMKHGYWDSISPDVYELEAMVLLQLNSFYVKFQIERKFQEIVPSRGSQFKIVILNSSSKNVSSIEDK